MATKNGKGYQRPSGPLHGAQIKAGQTAKKLAEQLKHCEHQNKQLEVSSRKAEQALDLVAAYEDLVGALWEFIPKNTNMTHGPTRRVLKTLWSKYKAQGKELGASFYED